MPDDDSNGQSEQPKRSVGQRMGIAAIILSASIFLSRILGFLREAVIAYTHGAGMETDAYYAAFTLPELMSYFLAGGTLSITFIPLFSAYVTRGDEEGGWRLFSTIATTMGAALVVFTITAELLAPTVVPILFPGFDDPQQLELAVSMTRIVIPAQLCFYFGGLIQATLFVKEVFWPSAVAPLIYNICIILGGVLLDPFIGIQGFSVGVVVGAVLGPLGLPLWAARRNVKFSFSFAPRDPDFKKFVFLTLPLMIGVSLVTVDEWLLRYFGSLHEDGAITWLNNARKLMLVLFAIIGQAAGQAALPFLTRLYHEGKESEMGQMLARSLRRVLFLAVIGAAGLIVVADPLVWVIFRRGAFEAHDAQMTATLLTFFAIGLASWATQTLAVRGFYARKDTITPMIIGTCTVAIALPFYFILDEKFGVVGLAAATSVGMSLNAVATVLVYRWRKGELPFRPLLAGLGRGLLFAVVCSAASWGAMRALPSLADWAPLWREVTRLAAISVAFAIAGGLLALIVRPPELEFVLSRLRRRLKKN